MVSVLSIEQTKEMLCRVCDEIIREKERLTLLDGPIGDGDHGIGMSRGMAKAKAALRDEKDPGDINSLFYKMGRTMSATMGGSSGVIFGTMFMGAVKGMEKQERLDADVFAGMMRNGLEAVKKRGKSLPGEKTMVDALEPAVSIMEKAGTKDLKDLLRQARKAAEQGAEATRDMVSKHGHSNTLGTRSLGYMDPGAVSVAIIFRAMEDYLDSGQ